MERRQAIKPRSRSRRDLVSPDQIALVTCTFCHEYLYYHALSFCAAEIRMWNGPYVMLLSMCWVYGTITCFFYPLPFLSRVNSLVQMIVIIILYGISIVFVNYFFMFLIPQNNMSISSSLSKENQFLHMFFLPKLRV